MAGGTSRPGETVTGTMLSEPLALGTQVANAAGEVTFTWTIPAGTELGAHSVVLEGTDSGSVSGTFRVVASDGGLAPTGLDLGVTVPIGIMLALFGTWAVITGRRKLAA